MVGWHPDWMDMSLSKLQELVIDRVAWRAVVLGSLKETDTIERLNWLTDTYVYFLEIYYTLYSVKK